MRQNKERKRKQISRRLINPHCCLARRYHLETVYWAVLRKRLAVIIQNTVHTRQCALSRLNTDRCSLRHDTADNWWCSRTVVLHFLFREHWWRLTTRSHAARWRKLSEFLSFTTHSINKLCDYKFTNTKHYDNVYCYRCS